MKMSLEDVKYISFVDRFPAPGHQIPARIDENLDCWFYEQDKDWRGFGHGQTYVLVNRGKYCRKTWKKFSRDVLNTREVARHYGKDWRGITYSIYAAIQITEEDEQKVYEVQVRGTDIGAGLEPFATTLDRDEAVACLAGLVIAIEGLNSQACAYEYEAEKRKNAK